ncbi:hypothetical protein QTP88_010369 [Uroleucon formosanum]
MFLNTFGLKESTIRYWLQKESLSENILPRNVREDLGIVDEETECEMETENDVKPCNFALIIMESDTADSDISVSYYSYSVDELYEAVKNSSKLVTRRTTVK